MNPARSTYLGDELKSPGTPTLDVKSFLEDIPLTRDTQSSSSSSYPAAVPAPLQTPEPTSEVEQPVAVSNTKGATPAEYIEPNPTAVSDAKDTKSADQHLATDETNPSEAVSDASAAEHHTSNPDEAENPKPKRQKRTPGKQSKHFKEYAVVFKGNGSSKWDGKEISVDGEWLEDLYGAAELFPGRVVQLLWGETNWKAVVSRIPCKEDFSVYFLSLLLLN